MFQPKIAVIALQGDFERHIIRIRELGGDAYAARTPAEIEEADGIILPGGESTTIGKLMVRYAVDIAIQNANAIGKPIYGTCAGMILLAKSIQTETAEAGGQPTLGLMDITVARNAYGRQVDSFETVLHDSILPGYSESSVDLSAVFIRAPAIIAQSPNVQTLAKHDNKPVLVQEGSILASSFHPELTTDVRVHEYYLHLTRRYADN